MKIRLDTEKEAINLVAKLKESNQGIKVDIRKGFDHPSLGIQYWDVVFYPSAQDAAFALNFDNKDEHGYTRGNWHPVVAESVDAQCAWQIAGHCSKGVDRVEAAEEDAKRLRRQIEDRLRKDTRFFNKVALLSQHI